MKKFNKKTFIKILFILINIIYIYNNFNIYLKNDAYKIRYFLQNKYEFLFYGYCVLDREYGNVTLFGNIDETKDEYQLTVRVQNGWGRLGEVDGNFDVDFKEEPLLWTKINLPSPLILNGIPYNVNNYGREVYITLFIKDKFKESDLKYIELVLRKEKEKEEYFISKKIERKSNNDDYIIKEYKSTDIEQQKLREDTEQFIGAKLEDLVYNNKLYGYPRISYNLSDILKNEFEVDIYFGYNDYASKFIIRKDEKRYYISESNLKLYKNENIKLSELKEYKNVEPIQTELKKELEESLGMKLEDIIFRVNKVCEDIMYKYKLSYKDITIFKIIMWIIFTLIEIIIYYLIKRKLNNKEKIDNINKD